MLNIHEHIGIILLKYELKFDIDTTYVKAMCFLSISKKYF